MEKIKHLMKLDVTIAWKKAEQNTGDEELESQAQASLSPIHLVGRLHLLRLLLTDRHVKSAAVRCDGVILWQARRQSRKTVGKAELLWYLMPTANNGYVLQPAAYPYPRTFACPSSGRAKVWGYGHGHDLFCRVTKPAQLVWDAQIR